MPASVSDATYFNPVSGTGTLEHDVAMEPPPKRVTSVDAFTRPSLSTRHDVAPKKEVVLDASAVARRERTQLVVDIPESKLKAMCVYLYSFVCHMIHELVCCVLYDCCCFIEGLPFVLQEACAQTSPW